MSRVATRTDFPGGLTAEAYLQLPRTEADIMQDVDEILRAWNRVRHNRETLGRIGADMGVSRESIRKGQHVERHADLLAKCAAGTMTINEAYRATLEREGRAVPDRRTSVSTNDPVAAMRVLARHFTGQQIAEAYTQVFGYGDSR